MAGTSAHPNKELKLTSDRRGTAPTVFEVAALGGLWLAGALTLVVISVAKPSWAPYLLLLAVLVTCAFAARLRRIPLSAVSAALIPRTWRQGAAATAAVIAVVAATIRVPGVVRSAYDSLTGPHYSLLEADIRPLGTTAPPEAIAAAARTIPVDATYSVVGGDQNDVWAVFRFWLAPRQFDPNYRTAPWVVLYDDPHVTGLRPGRKRRLAPHIYVLEVRG